jgi:hypothetical protein
MYGTMEIDTVDSVSHLRRRMRNCALAGEAVTSTFHSLYKDCPDECQSELNDPCIATGAAADRDLLSLGAKTRISQLKAQQIATVCKVGNLEGFPKPFWIWKHIHVHKVHV